MSQNVPLAGGRERKLILILNVLLTGWQRSKSDNSGEPWLRFCLRLTDIEEEVVLLLIPPLRIVRRLARIIASEQVLKTVVE